MKKRITIGLFNDAFYPAVDGVVSVVDNYARLLSKKANVIVFVPDYKKEYDDSIYPYKVVRVKSIKIPTVEYTFALPKIDVQFYRELSMYNLDIIHVHSPFSLGMTAIRYAKKIIYQWLQLCIVSTKGIYLILHIQRLLLKWF